MVNDLPEGLQVIPPLATQVAGKEEYQVSSIADS
jgi:hypothetical protein